MRCWSTWLKRRSIWFFCLSLHSLRNSCSTNLLRVFFFIFRQHLLYVSINNIISCVCQPYYCSVCEALMVTGEGAYCDCCGICADRGCIKAADRKFKCKVIASSDKGPMKHHWVKGKFLLLLHTQTRSKGIVCTGLLKLLRQVSGKR
jgi:hypothetical protein